MKTSKFYGLRGNNLALAVGFIAGMDFFLLGFDQGVMSGLLTLASFTSVFPRIDTTNASGNSSQSTIQGITVGSYNLGSFAGAIFCIWIGNYLGRKKTIFTGASIMIVGAIIQASSFGLPQLIIGRVVTGLGNGLSSSTVPTWQSETSAAHKRGMMVMIEGALITCGIMVSYWLDYGFSFIPGSVSWRFPIAFQIVPATIIITLILGLPESPRWLILKGREDEANVVLSALMDLPENDRAVANEFSSIKDTVIEASKGSFSDVFTMDKNRNFHRAALGAVSQMFQQISGINILTYYASLLYERDVGLSPTKARLLSACNGTEYFAASLIPIFTIEKFGRRQLMMFGATGMSISMAVLAGTVSISATNKAAGIVAAIFLFVFNTFFAIGWLGMTWLYPSEIVPLRIRAQSSAISTSSNWIFNFLIVMIAPVAFSSIGYNTYVIFACINAAIVPCVYFFFPETAYRSLEEMDSIFHKTTNAFDVVKLARPSVTPNKYDKHGKMIYSDSDDVTYTQRMQSATDGNVVDVKRGSPPDETPMAQEKSFDNADTAEKRY